MISGAIEEKVYSLDSNPESIIKEIEKIPATQVCHSLNFKF